jgi:hypothetical protein
MDGQKRIMVTGLTINMATDAEGVGVVRREGGKEYKWVKFTGATAVVAGDVVCYADAATQTTVDKANAAVAAGVAVAAAAAGAVSYGWIQTKGLCVLANALAGTPAAGNMMTNTGAANGVATKAAAATDCVLGVAVHVANKIVDLRCGY